MPTMPTSTISEAQGHPKEQLRKYGFRATRRVRVEWADRYDWATWFMYSGETTNNYPYFVAEGIPTNSAITSIGIEPDETTTLTHGDASVSQAKYTHAYLTLAYESATYELGDLLIQELHSYIENVPIINYFNGRAVQDTYAVCGYFFSIHYPLRAYVPTGVAYLPGKLNMEAIVPRMFPTLVFPTGTLLYTTGDCRGSDHYDGTRRYSVTHQMKYRPFDHNWVWNPYAGGWALPAFSKYTYTAFSTQF